MKTQTNIVEILQQLANVEQLAADLYAHYANLFSNEQSAADLFLQMQLEEESHKDQVLLQKLMISRVLASRDFIEVDMSGVDAVANAILSQIAQNSVSLAQAIDFAIWMETTGMESAYRIAAAKYSVPLEKLARKLSFEDSAHVEKLKTIKARLG